MLPNQTTMIQYGMHDVEPSSEWESLNSKDLLKKNIYPLDSLISNFLSELLYLYKMQMPNE